MQIPQDLRYTDNHEWVRVESDGAVTLGISDYAQKALHDVVYVDLPDVDRIVEAGEGIAEVESTKSVNDVYSPISGVVATVNELLMDAPELINSDPFGAGWIVTITPAEGSSLDDLMDAVAYTAFTEE
ncbi:MAG: glycine cleavage system protein GcvH [Actinomycetota bacterium]|nr:glycine cleavage system protein GcvH [Actinomycetota bacterium]